MSHTNCFLPIFFSRTFSGSVHCACIFSELFFKRPKPASADTRLLSRHLLWKKVGKHFPYGCMSWTQQPSLEIYTKECGPYVVWVQAVNDCSECKVYLRFDIKSQIRRFSLKSSRAIMILNAGGVNVKYPLRFFVFSFFIGASREYWQIPILSILFLHIVRHIV